MTDGAVCGTFIPFLGPIKRRKLNDRNPLDLIAFELLESRVRGDVFSLVTGKRRTDPCPISFVYSTTKTIVALECLLRLMTPCAAASTIVRNLLSPRSEPGELGCIRAAGPALDRGARCGVKEMN